MNKEKFLKDFRKRFYKELPDKSEYEAMYSDYYWQGVHEAFTFKEKTIKQLVEALEARESFARTRFANDKDARAALRGVIRKEKKALKLARQQGYGE